MECRNIRPTIEELETLERYTLFGGSIGQVYYGIFHPSDRNIDSRCESVDAYILKGDRIYWGSFITLEKIKECLERYKETGENANGTYFDMEYPIIVEEINPRIVRLTIEDFLKKGKLEPFFR